MRVQGGERQAGSGLRPPLSLTLSHKGPTRGEGDYICREPRFPLPLWERVRERGQRKGAVMLALLPSLLEASFDAELKWHA